MKVHVKLYGPFTLGLLKDFIVELIMLSYAKGSNVDQGY